MKHRLVAALLIITFPLGMTAYYSTKSHKATPSIPAPAATVDVSPTQAPDQTPVPTQTPGQTPGQAPGASG